ncbi:MAG TPA: AAA family ATPase, partial [Candidatus Nitrosopolaris sp.]|nr:AAA family ATPase [Candidatus Nitrosopolaris sp.]
PLANDVSLHDISRSTKGFSGADIGALCREAAIRAMRSNSSNITNSDFLSALQIIKPSITKDVEEWYASMKNKITYSIPKQIDKAFYG